MSSPSRYNIRVYGICIDDSDRVLLTDERRGSILMTKFPGGGHDLGEGIGDALRREFREECDAEIELLDLFYLNDFLQISAFNPQDQLLSIYYQVALIEQLKFPVKDRPFDFEPGEGDQQTFRWVKINDLDIAEFRFPVDKIVVQKLQDAAPQHKTPAGPPLDRTDSPKTH